VWLFNWFKKQDDLPSTTEERPRILALAMSIDDRVLLSWLGKENNWELRFTQSPREAFALALDSHFAVILCDRNQPGYPWREVLSRLAVYSPRSCVLLVSPVRDDDLWQSVLQHGGYDVLIRPLRESAALQTIQAALRFVFPKRDVPVGC
jgi:DNA-binding NtrC family response regulator